MQRIAIHDPQNLAERIAGEVRLRNLGTLLVLGTQTTEQAESQERNEEAQAIHVSPPREYHGGGKVVLSAREHIKRGAAAEYTKFR
ncbi:MAG: hypothetical protein HUU15_14825 [Candidatus Brocadiae bacterium]|nr:hypothetical protein [Candidatus Brocadiia bacterium]